MSSNVIKQMHTFLVPLPRIGRVIARLDILEAPVIQLPGGLYFRSSCRLQRCSLGFDVSVSKQSRDALPNVSVSDDKVSFTSLSEAQAQMLSKAFGVS